MNLCKLIALVFASAASLTAFSCGDGQTVGSDFPDTSDNGSTTELQKTTSTEAEVNDSLGSPGSPQQPSTVPVMPNINPEDAAAVTNSAVLAFEAQWGDGSGVNVIWGPNIVEGWAILGIENESGQAGMEVLTHKEGGAWVAKDMGGSLAGKWRPQTPPGLWP